jgi:hypothetical protein
MDQQNDQITDGENEDLELPQFEFAKIVNATNNFSIKNKLGHGGFGPVYKVCLLMYKNNNELGFCSEKKRYAFYWCHFVGYTRRWTRNCCEEVINELQTRIKRVQK